MSDDHEGVIDPNAIDEVAEEIDDEEESGGDHEEEEAL